MEWSIILFSMKKITELARSLPRFIGPILPLDIPTFGKTVGQESNRFGSRYYTELIGSLIRIQEQCPFCYIHGPDEFKAYPVDHDRGTICK